MRVVFAVEDSSVASSPSNGWLGRRRREVRGFPNVLSSTFAEGLLALSSLSSLFRRLPFELRMRHTGRARGIGAF
jgi:hypothetical protein